MHQSKTTSHGHIPSRFFHYLLKNQVELIVIFYFTFYFMSSSLFDREIFINNKFIKYVIKVIFLQVYQVCYFIIK